MILIALKRTVKGRAWEGVGDKIRCGVVVWCGGVWDDEGLKGRFFVRTFYGGYTMV